MSFGFIIFLNERKMWQSEQHMNFNYTDNFHHQYSNLINWLKQLLLNIFFLFLHVLHNSYIIMHFFWFVLFVFIHITVCCFSIEFIHFKYVLSFQVLIKVFLVVSIHFLVLCMIIFNWSFKVIVIFFLSVPVTREWEYLCTLLYFSSLFLY